MNKTLSLEDEELSSLCWQAVTKWGEHAQIDMAIEECAELIKALLKYRRDPITHRYIVEESIDVFLMLGQLMTMFGGAELFHLWYDKKITHLEKILRR